MNASEVVDALLVHYGCAKDKELGSEWAALREFSLRPGAGDQRIDVMFVRAWAGAPKGHERHAVEVKVSRTDLLGELKNPHKRLPFEEVSHRFYLATPEGLVRDGELPDGVGLYEVRDRGGRRTVRRKVTAARRTPARLDERSFVEAFRRAGRAELRVAAPDDNDLPAQVAALRKEAQRATSSAERARSTTQQLRNVIKQLVSVFSAVITCPCQRCGETIVPLQRSGRITWEHMNPGDCPYGYPDLDELVRRAEAGELFPLDIAQQHPDIITLPEEPEAPAGQ